MGYAKVSPFPATVYYSIILETAALRLVNILRSSPYSEIYLPDNENYKPNVKIC